MTKKLEDIAILRGDRHYEDFLCRGFHLCKVQYFRFSNDRYRPGLELYVKPEIIIDNHAMGGRSTKSFIDEGRLKVIEGLIGEGDFLFIQFGHNDEKSDEKRHTTPFGTYKENLKKYIQVARNAGAIPVLVTPVSRRCFVDACKLTEETKLTHYAAGMRQVAEEEQVALVDLYSKSRAKLEEAGAVETTKWFRHLAKGEYPAFPQGLVDNTHLKPEGARVFAGLVAEGLKELGGVYAELLVEGF